MEKLVGHPYHFFSKSQTSGTYMILGWNNMGNLTQTADVTVSTIEGTETRSGIGAVTDILAGYTRKIEESNQSLSMIKI